MPNISHSVARYFTPSKETFWKWSDDQQHVLWTFGATIAFRRELELLLEGLAGEGLPPFENVLMVVAACRNQPQAECLRLADVLDFSQYPMGFSLVESISKTVEALRLLSQLPEDLRTSLNGKRAILLLVAENGPRRRPPDFSRECLEWLHQGDAADATLQIKPTSEWSAELRGLCDGLLAVNESAVRLRMQTGVELLPNAAPEPLQLPEAQPEPPVRTIRDAVDELEDDEEYAGLVRLTRRLLSIVSLPRLLSTPDDLQLGGVSDITNRGSFDRLLLSELAQDSDVLMTRVALNEAMYIRREVPPVFPPRECQILVDCGIRMWGLPRLYASAVALALGIVQDGRSVPRLFRSSVQGPVAADVASREGLVQFLSSLEPSAQPGDSLTVLVRETRDARADFVVVTGEDVLDDLEFQQCLSALPRTSLYLVTVTREGQLRLLQRTHRGVRILKQARLELDQILATPARIRPQLRDLSIDPRLPAICRVRPFPLLLSPQVLNENCGGCLDLLTPGKSVEKLLGVTGDRRLLRWNEAGMGATQYTDRLPPGKLLWYNSKLIDIDDVQVLVGNREQGHLHKVLATIESDVIQTFELPYSPPIKGVYVHAGVVYVIFKNQTVLFSFDTCKRLAVAEHLPDSTWVNGRFHFARDEGHRGWYALTYDGRTTGWDRILQPGQLHATGIETLFDCEGLGTPVAVTTRNTVIKVGSHEELTFSVTSSSSGSSPVPSRNIGQVGQIVRPMKLAAVSPDGNRLVLADTTNTTQYGTPGTAQVTSDGLNQYGNHWFVDLATLEAHQLRDRPHRLLYRQAYALPSQRNLRNRFASIGLSGGQLTLVTSKKTLVSVALSSNSGRIVLKSVDMKSEVQHVAGFQQINSPLEVGYELKSAEWPDGSRAILDSRGLLHLQSSNRALPELTLVLYEENVAGWCDQNMVWGDHALTRRDLQRIDPEQAFLEWIMPFCRRLQ